MDDLCPHCGAYWKCDCEERLYPNLTWFRDLVVKADAQPSYIFVDEATEFSRDDWLRLVRRVKGKWISENEYSLQPLDADRLREMRSDLEPPRT